MNSAYFSDKLQDCPCGKQHVFPLKEILSGKGVTDKIAEVLARYNLKKPFIVADVNTYKAAGEKVAEILRNAGARFATYIFDDAALEPDEKAVDSVMRAFDETCDAVIGVGSGVINDVCKILSHEKNKFYIIVCTAPSMDGYASATSSMNFAGVKTSVNSKCPEVIIGDVDILKNAPLKMLKAGLGDMLAKYVSILEWRLSHEINGEYYCENVAQMIRSARDKCVANAKGLIKREDTAVQAVFDGLIVGGIAMAYAGVSRPASGVEHYISHIIDMRSVQFGTKADLHGIQCAIATLIATKLYERLTTLSPTEAKGAEDTARYDRTKWEQQLREFLGKSAEAMIALEDKEKKYDLNKSAARRKIIIEKWERIKEIISEELPCAERIREILTEAEIPLTFDETDVKIDLEKAFARTKDIRDKYVLSSLLWDIGYLSDFCALL